MLNVKGKLNKLEKRLKPNSDPDEFAVVKEWVNQGLTFGQLTPEQQELYIKYQGFDVTYLYDLFEVVPDFLLELKDPPPKTKAEEERQFRERCREIREIMQSVEDEYNSGEKQQEREEEYRKVQEIARQRQMAFERGESMDKYPLPWQEGAKNE